MNIPNVLGTAFLMEQFQWLLFSYVLVESTKLRGLRDNVGCVDPWVRGLRGSNFYVGCVGYVGQNIFYVSQGVTRVIILRGLRGSSIYFFVGQRFLQGSIF